MRKAFIDTSVLCRDATRRVIGFVAEAQSFSLAISSTVVDEAFRLEGRLLITQPDRRQHVQRQFDDLRAWIGLYESEGLLHIYSVDDMYEGLSVTARREMDHAGTIWNEAQADPDDLPIALDAHACHADSLFTGNLRCIEYPDWSRFTKAFASRTPMTLCKGDRMIEWAWHDDVNASDHLFDLSLSRFHDTPTLGKRMQGWAT